MNGIPADFTTMTDVRGTAFTLTGGATLDLANASEVNGTSFIINDGVTLTLPAALPDYAHAGGNGTRRSFRAQGVGSGRRHSLGIVDEQHEGPPILVIALQQRSEIARKTGLQSEEAMPVNQVLPDSSSDRKPNRSARISGTSMDRRRRRFCFRLTVIYTTPAIRRRPIPQGMES